MKKPTLEAELMEIVNNAEGDNGWPAQIMNENNASNGKLIDNVQANDQVNYTIMHQKRVHILLHYVT